MNKFGMQDTNEVICGAFQFGMAAREDTSKNCR